ncbi:MAG: bifunctional oligoribonuclease/PAP phosphatase NrnA [Candidatus Moranbacteria bacterium]|nr:bifunctional oligoribonuclease/PAP phosphatase NrnA [Candidatus Moranbacteria bacterium]
MHKFAREFNALRYVIKKSNKILLVAHSGPDGDTVGSVLALKEYLKDKRKLADIACFDPLPPLLGSAFPSQFEYPDHLDLKSYETVIAADSVERGFDKIKNQLLPNQVIVLLDHHPDITLKGDINIIDSSYSSVCEIVYDYLEFTNEQISKNIAASLMLGILSDTGNFQHSNTTARVMEIASSLMRKGISLSKIIDAALANKKISTLKLWGRAFEKAKINPKNGMIITALTKEDIEGCNASTDDIAQLASILNTVPGTKFSLILSERESGVIKGSLRSEDYKGVDVSAIARHFGGGGHILASGFEVKGRIVETDKGWEII